nr:MAG TPA: hypothetical protein [Caudoviricetes sp.]
MIQSTGSRNLLSSITEHMSIQDLRIIPCMG